MKKNKNVIYLESAFKELNIIYEKQATPDNIKEWKQKVLPKLTGTAKIKINRIEIVRFPNDSYSFEMEKMSTKKKLLKLF